ncbi:MBL fold metallo-hydrolase [Fodinibius salsisoli]|uniref:MBL fold metallo-hydrolase n=1 Tax=Fodinibius salsisoli TaxID=2820877 RepID=A0ABT3PJ08_9BACT|nr:MBL fold metallo-hydrolase [Fodinibius salsisoli]MCW9705897.1 MBL fold metallo-hydrolase [Fodinibius salsisoli]
MANSVTKNLARPLYEGTFSVGLDKKFNRIDREDPPAKGALKISLNPFLIESGDKYILFDVGIGDFGEDTSTETIKENLSAHGLTEYDITDIFLSHLHYDHLGGLAGRGSGYWELTFPDAKLWVSGQGWADVMAKEEFYDEEKTAFAHFLDAKADLHFLDEEDQPYPEVSVKTIGGHTKYSQLLAFDDGKQKYLMAGDVLANRGEVNRTFEAKYDVDPKRSMKMRNQITRKAYEEDFAIMGYHDSHHSIFKLTDYDEQQGYKIEPVA